MVATTALKFEGSNGFRQKLILATLSQKTIKFTNIRSDPEVNAYPGLKEYEISFLRLLEKLTNGSTIQISHTGTSLAFKPGMINGGVIAHECTNSRGIGYFLEPLIALAPFAKNPVQLTLTGVTNCNLDMSVDTIRTCILPQLQKYGIQDGLQLKVAKRGAYPFGGGEIYFSCPVIKELNPIIFESEGRIKRIRGIAYATRVSPQMANRVMESARSLLTRYIPDVFVYTDVYKGLESGKSPGYALTLVAESNTGVLLSAECAYQPKPKSPEEADALSIEEKELITKFNFQTPEDLGRHVAYSLLNEIEKGGCYDSNCQWLGVLFAALSPEDICKLRLGELTDFTIQYLRDIKTFFNVTFNIEPQNEQDVPSNTLILTCQGSGFANVNKKMA